MFLPAEEIEMLSNEEIWERHERPALERQLRRVLEHSEFYRQKYEAAGLQAREACKPTHFDDLPFVEKAELLAEQEAYPPYGRLAAPAGSLRRIHSTSGSTGRPLFIAMTEKDIMDTLDAGRRAFRCAGLGPEDTVIHCLSYCLWAGGLTDHLSLEATGATVIPFGVGNTKQLLQTILNLRPTAISCTPSYVSRLEVVLKEEFGLGPRDLGLKKALFGGEGGLQQSSVRRQIEEAWGMQAIDANYGMADLLSIFGAECDARQGLHFHGQGIIRMQLIDPQTTRPIPMETARQGEMVLSNLCREAQPLLRYRTGDLIRIVGTDMCACGRRSVRFQVIGRSDDMLVVRGVNVFPQAVSSLLAERSEWFSGEFEFVLDSPAPIERPLLRVEMSKSLVGAQARDIEQFVQAQCHQKLTFTPRVELVPFGALPRTESKTRRVRRTYR